MCLNVFAFHKVKHSDHSRRYKYLTPTGSGFENWSYIRDTMEKFSCFNRELVLIWFFKLIA